MYSPIPASLLFWSIPFLFTPNTERTAYFSGQSYAEFSEFKLLIYGALLIWMMLKRPEGLIPNVRRSRELHQEEFLQDAWLKAQANDDDDEAASGEVAPA